MYKIPAKNSILAKKVIFMPSCHSTNDICADLIEKREIEEGSVIIAGFQEKGKGQGENQWVSEKDESLTLSYYLNTSFLPIKEQFYLNMAVSLAVSETVTDFLDDKVLIKWPNDIYYVNKIAGILIQNSLKGTKMEYSIVGIGLNVNQVKFHIDNATSFRSISGNWYDLQLVFENLSYHLETYYVRLKAGKFAFIRGQYMKKLLWLNKSHNFSAKGELFSGKIVDILPFGNIVIETDGQRKNFAFQEVSFLK